VGKEKRLIRKGSMMKGRNVSRHFLKKEKRSDLGTSHSHRNIASKRRKRDCSRKKREIGKKTPKMGKILMNRGGLSNFITGLGKGNP